MKVVFNAEDGYRILGPYALTDDDVVLYKSGTGIKTAPADCVVVRDVTPDEMKAEIDRQVRSIRESAGWFGMDDTVALSGLVQSAVEIIEYAQLLGAERAVSTCYYDLRRRVNEGSYVGERTHARQFEETTV